MAPLIVSKLGLFAKVSGWTIWELTPALLKAVLYKFPVALVKFIALQGWDIGLFLGNIFTPQLKKGSVIKPGVAGHGGVWPPFVPPTATDSRSPCPYLSESIFILPPFPLGYRIVSGS